MRYHLQELKPNCLKIDQELTKRYYSIGEVATLFGVSNSLLRYWEAEFSILKPTKNSKGDRRFTVKDIRNLERIYTLVKERGFTLEGASKELRKKPVINKNADVIVRLRKVKAKLQAIDRSLDV